MSLASISLSSLSFQFVRSGTANVDVHAQVRGLFCMLFMMTCSFVKARALNLGVLPMIVHPAPRCGRHRFYLRCCHVVLRGNGSSFVSRLVALSFKQYRGCSIFRGLSIFPGFAGPSGN